MSTESTTGPLPIHKRRPKAGQRYDSINMTLPRPLLRHLREQALATGRSVAEQATEALVAATGVGADYLRAEEGDAPPLTAPRAIADTAAHGV